MRLLITGAFGNIGQNAFRAALHHPKVHELIGFDIKTPKTVKIRDRLYESTGNDKTKTIWGDILEEEDIRSAVKGVDAVIHLAAILHPKTEKNPELAYKVNVKGTENLVECVKEYINKNQSKRSPKIVLASSVSLYGPWPPNDKLIAANTPIKPTDVYTRTKAEAEKIIRESELPWVIFRISGAPPLSLVSIDNMNLIYNMPLNQQIEFIHTKDVGVAFVHAAVRDVQNSILLIGGGKKCQITNRDLMEGYFKALGLKMLSEDSFKEPKSDDDWFYVGWLDTSESQNLLNYQKHTFEDFLEELKDEIGWKRKLLKVISPFVKKYLEFKSPHRK